MVVAPITMVLITTALGLAFGYYVIRKLIQAIRNVKGKIEKRLLKLK